jgi:hypothetical protein
LLDDGSMLTWGSGEYGQLGNGVLFTSSSLPVAVRDAAGTGSLTAITAFSGGSSHILAVQGVDGTLWAWGRDDQGQLGDGTLASSSLPVTSAIVLGASVPPDQGNVLRAVRRAADVELTWTGAANSWGVYRDSFKDRLGRTELPPSVTSPIYVDAGRATSGGIDFYRIRGISCGGIGP